MPIQPIEPQRLYRQIGDQLRALIEAGEFPVGSRLPSERVLAVQLGVSRPSLREALIALEVEGYIEVRMGSGIYVSQTVPSAGARLDLSGEEAPLELIRARYLVEGEVAAAAARHGKKADFEAIEKALGVMQTEARQGKKPLDADRIFHIRLAEATGNSVLIGLVKRLFEARMGPLFNQLHDHFETAEVWAQAIAEHREILDAVRAQNPSRARTAMHRHMDIAFRRLTSSLTQRPASSPAKVKKAAARKAPTKKTAPPRAARKKPRTR